jgi:hypothetical protein
MSAEFIRRKILEGTAAAVPKFCGQAGARPSKPLFATRYSPFAAVLSHVPLFYCQQAAVGNFSFHFSRSNL